MVRHFVTPIKTQTPLKKILGLFHWVAHFTRNVRLFTARRTTTVTVYCWRLTGSSYCGGFWGGAVNPLQQILGLFHLEWLILVQIPLYFNRNVRQFTARTTTGRPTCIHVLLAAEGVWSNPPRYEPDRRLIESIISILIVATHLTDFHRRDD